MSTPAYPTPGVYRDEVVLQPPAPLRTGIPAFLGSVDGTPAPAPLAVWADFSRLYTPAAGSYLGDVVRAFFENGGARCWVIPVAGDSAAGLEAALTALDALDEIDLVCVPDAFRRRPGFVPEWETGVAPVQHAVLDRCERSGTRFAILDSLPPDTHATTPLPSGAHPRVRLQAAAFDSAAGALYYPWLRPLADPSRLVPPCGHVAAVYATTDARAGVHKAPANEQLLGVVDVETVVSQSEQGDLNVHGVNCIRAFPGRGIRVWGARTLSSDPSWRYVNVRRIFSTAARWIERNLDALVFEPNGPALWAAIRLRLTVYLTGLHRSGALQGATPADAFYVKCDADTNSPETRDAGRVVTEIGLAPAVPNEFVVVHIVHDAGGATIVVAPGR